MSKKNKVPAGKIIALIVALLIVAAFVQPSLLFFLPEHAQAAVRTFTQSYLASSQPLQNSEGGFDFNRVWAIIIVALGCWLVGNAIQLILNAINIKNRHANTVKSLAASMLKYIVVIYGIIYGLSILGFNVGAVIASLGVLGLIIGFGAQSLIEDIITGLFLVLEGQIQVGDIVAVDDWRGTVTSIGIRTTSIMDTGNNTRIVNNSDIRNFVNLSGVSSLAVVLASVAYETDLIKAEECVKQLCLKMPTLYPEIFKVAPKYAGVENLGASSVDLKITAEVDEVNIFIAKRLLNREIFLALGEAGIEIPFNQQVVHIAKD